MSPDDPPPPPVPPDAPAPSSQPDLAPSPKRKGHGCLIAAIVGGVLFLLATLLIVAFLAGIGFPSYQAVMRKMKHQQARTLAMSLVNSIKGYYSEYSRYPLPQDGTAGEVSPLRTDEVLTDTLLGAGVETNPKKINFLPELKRVERGGGFGLLTEGDSSMIVDPWGEEYYVLMDADYGGTIENPNAGSITGKLYQGVIVWSAGPDKDPSTWEDNVVSWESGKWRSAPSRPKATE